MAGDWRSSRAGALIVDRVPGGVKTEPREHGMARPGSSGRIRLEPPKAQAPDSARAPITTGRARRLGLRGLRQSGIARYGSRQGAPCRATVRTDAPDIETHPVMTDPRQSPPFYTRRTYRLLSGFFGLCLVGLGLYAMFHAGSSTTLQLVGGAALVLVGANMTVCAFRARESWLSRIGPLP
jgi:hypothetical protein